MDSETAEAGLQERYRKRPTARQSRMVAEIKELYSNHPYGERVLQEATWGEATIAPFGFTRSLSRDEWTNVLYAFGSKNLAGLLQTLDREAAEKAIQFAGTVAINGGYREAVAMAGQVVAEHYKNENGLLDLTERVCEAAMCNPDYANADICSVLKGALKDGLK